MDAKNRCLNQREHHSHTTHAKRESAETQCFRRFFGRGRRTWSLLPLRSVCGRAPLVLAVSPTGSGAAPRWGASSTDRRGSGDRRRSLRATGTHSPLGTRFWSGCGVGLHGAGKGLCCPILPASPQKSGAGLMLWGFFGAEMGEKSPEKPQQ